MLSRICTSRGESGAKTCVDPGPYTESSRNSARTLEATAVRLQLVRLRDGLFTVGSHADDLHVRLFLDDLPDAHGGDATRIGEKDPDRAFGPFAHSCSL